MEEHTRAHTATCRINGNRSSTIIYKMTANRSVGVSVVIWCEQLLKIVSNFNLFCKLQ